MIDGVVYSVLEGGEFLPVDEVLKKSTKTSQPPVGYYGVFEKICQRKMSSISIHMSHALSGTVEAQLVGFFAAKADVTVVDSSFTDQTMKFQVVELLKWQKAGATLEILEKLEEDKAKTELYTLAYQPEIWSKVLSTCDWF